MNQNKLKSIVGSIPINQTQSAKRSSKISQIGLKSFQMNTNQSKSIKTHHTQLKKLKQNQIPNQPNQSKINPKEYKPIKINQNPLKIHPDQLTTIKTIQRTNNQSNPSQSTKKRTRSIESIPLNQNKSTTQWKSTRSNANQLDSSNSDPNQSDPIGNNQTLKIYQTQVKPIQSKTIQI